LTYDSCLTFSLLTTLVNFSNVNDTFFGARGRFVEHLVELKQHNNV